MHRIYQTNETNYRIHSHLIMKKTTIIALAAVAILATFVLDAQVLGIIQTNSIQQDVVQTINKTVLVTTNGPCIFMDAQNCLAIGQQIGNMTNAAGQKLFLAQYFTNQNFSLTFSIQDTGSVVPTQIGISVGQQ